MANSTSDVRNVALAGHGGVGKTQLAEAILFATGAIKQAGTVENGKTVSDYTEEEIQKKISIHTTLMSTTYMGKTINILDMPGTNDFSGECVCGLRSCETAVLVVDAKDGAQIETIKLWRRLDERNKPRIVFVNRVDRESANFSTVYKGLKEEFSKFFVPIVFPMEWGPKFRGVVDLIENKAYFVSPDGKSETVGEIPPEYKEWCDKYHTELVERAAEGDDELMEKYFAEGTLSTPDICKGLTEGLTRNTFVPVLCGAGNSLCGIKPLLDFIANIAPSPMGKRDYIIKDGKVHDIFIGPDPNFAGYVWKTTLDQFSGKLSFIKVVKGELKSDSDIVNPRIGKKEHVAKIYRAVGKTLTETPVLVPGDIGVIQKCASASTNCTLLSDPAQAIEFKPLAFPTPVYALAINTPDKGSADKVNDYLHKVSEEDMSFKTYYNGETKETIIAGMGEMQLGMILDRIRDKMKIKVETALPKIAYRETITKKSGEVEFTHKKQSGGHGQYARVVINIEPLARGEEYAFTNAIKGMAVSKSYIPGIEKGLHEAMEHGTLKGYPVVDVSVTLLDGKEHPVDSSEMAFALAASGAMKDALSKAGPVMLEPIMNLSVITETKYVGDILSDLSSKRAHVQGQDDLGGGMSEIKAEVPQAEMLDYAIRLRSMTAGTASFEMEFCRYSESH